MFKNGMWVRYILFDFNIYFLLKIFIFLQFQNISPAQAIIMEWYKWIKNRALAKYGDYMSLSHHHHNLILNLSKKDFPGFCLVGPKLQVQSKNSYLQCFTKVINKCKFIFKVTGRFDQTLFEIGPCARYGFSLRKWWKP